jgi:hypothetical protein
MPYCPLWLTGKIQNYNHKKDTSLSQQYNFQNKKDKGQKDKHWSTEHYTGRLNSSYTTSGTRGSTAMGSPVPLLRI